MLSLLSTEWGAQNSCEGPFQIYKMSASKPLHTSLNPIIKWFKIYPLQITLQNHLAKGSLDTPWKLLSYLSNPVFQPFSCHKHPVNSLLFPQNAKSFWNSNFEHSVSLWLHDLNTQKCLVHCLGTMEGDNPFLKPALLKYSSRLHHSSTRDFIDAHKLNYTLPMALTTLYMATVSLNNRLWLFLRQRPFVSLL